MAKFKLTWEREGVGYCEFVDAKDEKVAIQKKLKELNVNCVVVSAEEIKVPRGKSKD